jgi:PPOX class probable F420-dependent enzyme
VQAADNRTKDDAMTDIPAGFLDLLTEKKAFAHIATLQPDGSPQVTPVWFDYTNGLVRVNTAKGRIKARNLSVGSKVALSILDPDNAYRYIQIRGTVSKETTDGAVAHIDSLAKKYLGKDVYPWHNEKETRVIYEITPSAAQTMG